MLEPNLSLSQISSIVEEQLVRWAYRSQKGDKLTRKKFPVITLSRQYGTEGSKVASGVASKLGFDFWDQNLVHRVSESSGLAEDLIDSLDERSRSFIEDAISAIALGSQGSERSYIRQLIQTIQVISEHGKAVIVGRGSQYILKDKIFKVRLIAPLAFRVKKISQVESISYKEAELKIQMVDGERIKFHKNHFGKDLREPTHYDICLNIENFNNADLIDIIISAFSKRF